MSARSTNERHERATRMLGYALTLRTDDTTWRGLATVLECRMTPFERSCLLVAVIGSMDIEETLSIVQSIYGKVRVGMPLPPFLDPAEDAAWWADHAAIDERKAVLAAAFLSLPPRDQQAFLACAGRRAAA